MGGQQNFGGNNNFGNNNFNQQQKPIQNKENKNFDLFDQIDATNNNNSMAGNEKKTTDITMKENVDILNAETPFDF